MTDAEELTPPVSEKKTRRYLVPLVLGLLLLIIIAFFATHSGIDEALVKQQLDNFAARLKEQGKNQGRDIELTYGAIEITGGFSDRHAVVHDPKLLTKPLPENAPPPEAGKSNSLLLSTSVLELYPESADFSAMKIVLPQPIDVASEEEPAKSMLKIITNTPWALDVAQKTSGGGSTMHLHHVAPTEIHLTYLREQQATGEEDKTPTVVPVYETLIVTLDKGESDVHFEEGGTGLGQGTLEWRNIVITPEKLPEAAIKIADVTSKWSNQLNEQKLNVVSTSLHIGDITGPQDLLPYAPVSFALDLTYIGAMPESPAKVTAQSSSFKLKTLAFHSKNAALDATADFTGEPDDVLPVGAAHLSLTNIPFLVVELKKYNLLSAENEVLLVTIIEHVSAQRYDQVKDLSIDIKRPHGGAFAVGHSTFEELFTLFLQNKLSHIKPQMMMPLPPVNPEAASPTPKASDHASH